MTKELSPENILSLTRGFMESRIVITAAELDLFTLLADTSLTAQEVTSKLDALPRAITVLLDALSALGLLVKEQERYQTSPGLASFLSSKSPNSILPMVLHSGNLWKTWSGLTSIVRGRQESVMPGPTVWEGQELKAFIDAMHVVGTSLAEQVVAIINPGGAHALLDIGAGPGTYTLAFLKTCPNLRATLFDRPAVIEIARTRVEAAGLEHRATFVPGDFYTDNLPSGYDLALLSAIIHQNSPTQNVELFRKVHTALTRGGRLVIRDHLMKPDRTQPVDGAIFAVNMLVGTYGGSTYTFAEVETCLREAGFVKIRLIQEGERMDGLVEAYK